MAAELYSAKGRCRTARKVSCVRSSASAARQPSARGSAPDSRLVLLDQPLRSKPRGGNLTCRQISGRRHNSKRTDLPKVLSPRCLRSVRQGPRRSRPRTGVAGRSPSERPDHQTASQGPLAVGPDETPCIVAKPAAELTPCATQSSSCIVPCRSNRQRLVPVQALQRNREGGRQMPKRNDRLSSVSRIVLARPCRRWRSSWGGRCGS